MHIFPINQSVCQLAPFAYFKNTINFFSSNFKETRLPLSFFFLSLSLLFFSPICSAFIALLVVTVVRNSHKNKKPIHCARTSLADSRPIGYEQMFYTAAIHDAVHYLRHHYQHQAGHHLCMGRPDNVPHIKQVKQNAASSYFFFVFLLLY